jgi:hypothetical protein
MVSVIGAVDGAISTDITAVSPLEKPFPPRSNEIAFTVKYYYRVFTPIQNIYPVFGINRQATGIGE